MDSKKSAIIHVHALAHAQHLAAIFSEAVHKHFTYLTY